jgi:hypothetical protein
MPDSEPGTKRAHPSKARSGHPGAKAELHNHSWRCLADSINQFNQVVTGDHRFRAIRYLGLDEVGVVAVQELNSRPEYQLPEIW